MEKDKTIGVRTQGRPLPVPMGIGNPRIRTTKGIHRCPHRGELWPTGLPNEDRPRENTRGPDSRGGARGTLGGVSKVNNAPKNIKYDGTGN